MNHVVASIEVELRLNQTTRKTERRRRMTKSRPATGGKTVKREKERKKERKRAAHFLLYVLLHCTVLYKHSYIHMYVQSGVIKIRTQFSGQTLAKIQFFQQRDKKIQNTFFNL